MNILIILGHPDKNSFNHAIAKTCITQVKNNGHTIFFHDLYAEKFDPIYQIDNLNNPSDIDENLKTHCSNFKKCDGIIVIHPNWWGQPPAIIKGWLDRVLLPGIAYDFVLDENGKNNPIGLLKSKEALVFNTSNSPNNQEKDPLEILWKKHIFGFCGVKKNERRNFGVVKESSIHQRSEWLFEVKQLVNAFFPS